MKPKHEFSGQPSGACPNYFRIGIWRIRTGNLEYHNQGYDDPAWHLSIHLADEFEGERTELEELGILVDKEDDDGIIAWFKHYFPRVMKLIPPRRYGSFLNGFRRAVEDERVF
jgi:hypothetical protein